MLNQESGAWPLEIRVVKQQLKFWLSLQKFLEDHEEHYIGKLIAIADNYTYVKYFKNLQRLYGNQQTCESMLQNILKGKYEEKIRAASAVDEDSRLGAYLQINPDLVRPGYHEKLEFHRVCITGYRCGSHNLLRDRLQIMLNLNFEQLAW